MSEFDLREFGQHVSDWSQMTQTALNWLSIGLEQQTLML